MAKTATATKAAPAPAPSTVKSIVDPKYKNAYKDPAKRDWLAKFLDENAAATRDKKVTEGDGDGKVTKTIQVPDGVDVEKLFDIAKANGVDTAAYEAQAGSHGFGGRMRMTVGNILRRVAKQRHGIMNAGGTFVSAPTDFLEKVGADDKPTHTQGGEKIAVAKPEKPAETAPADVAPVSAAKTSGGGKKK